MAGTLHYLGFCVPGPYLGANESNPKGFFESRWATRLHSRITSDAGISIVDSRPTAYSRAQAAVPPGARRKLTKFLGRYAGESQLVVKDPRSVWFQNLWRESAKEAGFGIRYLTMLRHPAEVVGSRVAYYANHADAAGIRRYEIFSLARWVNNSLVNERETRGHPRSFVRYNDLLGDWRTAVTKMADELALHLPGDLTPTLHHPVDDFIDPTLRRVKVTWGDLEIPVELTAIADGVWEALDELCSAGGASDEASARLDELSGRYERLFMNATAISHDAIVEAVADAKRAAESAQRSADESAAARAKEEASNSQRTVDDLSGRELLAEAARRMDTRLRPRKRGRN